jgi:hypothetical protein
MSIDKPPTGSAEKNLISRIERVQSFEALYNVLNSAGDVRGSSRIYTAEELRKQIENVRSGTYSPDVSEDQLVFSGITRALGIRDAVKRLIIAEARAETAPTQKGERDKARKRRGRSKDTRGARGGTDRDDDSADSVPEVAPTPKPFVLSTAAREDISTASAAPDANPSAEIRPLDGSELPDTPAEARQVLKATIENVGDALAEKAGFLSERKAMQEAEAAYLSAYKDYYEKAGVLKRLGNSVRASGDKKQLNELELQYDQRRMGYMQAMEARLGERIANRLPTREQLYERYYDMLRNSSRKVGDPGVPTPDEYVDTYRERLERAYRKRIRFNEIIKPKDEKERAARIEALGAKGKSAFGNALGYMARQNAKLDSIGKNKARVIRVAAVSLAIAAGFGLTGIVAPAGLAGAFAARFGRGLIGSFAGAGAIFATGKGYEKWPQELIQSKAKKKLESTGREEKIESLTDLNKIHSARARHALFADDRTHQKIKLALQSLVGLGVGVGTAQTLSELGPFQELAGTTSSGENYQTDNGTESASATGTDSSASYRYDPGAFGASNPGTINESDPFYTKQLEGIQDDIARENISAQLGGDSEVAKPPAETKSSGPTEKSNAAADSATQKTGASTPDAMPDKTVTQASIEGNRLEWLVKEVFIERGDGFDNAFDTLQEHIQEAQAAGAKMSPLMQHILDSHPNELSREIAAAIGNSSMKMEVGDKLFFDTKGNLWLNQVGGTPQLLMENDPSMPSGYMVHQLNEEMLPDKKIVAEPASPEPVVDTPASGARAQEINSVASKEAIASVTGAEASEIESAVSTPKESLETSASGAESAPSAAESAIPAETSPPQEIKSGGYSAEEILRGNPETLSGVQKEVPVSNTPESAQNVATKGYSAEEILKQQEELARALSGEPPVPESPLGRPEGVFTNVSGLEVNPNEPHLYADNNGRPYVYGGSYAEMYKTAYGAALEKPNTAIYFEPKPELIDGKWVSWTNFLIADAKGNVSMGKFPYDGNPQALDPNIFTRMTK